MISFAKDHSDALWCYRNHDVSYFWRRLETGYSPYAERTVISRLEELFELELIIIARKAVRVVK